MSGPVVHPEGCRCPGCLPGQYVMRPASPPRPRQPARTPQRQPAGNLGSDEAKLWGYGIVFLLAVCTAIWPSWVWHGQTDAGGWRWDVHSTIACCIWWGLILAVIAVWRAAPGMFRSEWSQKALAGQSAPQARPLCTHSSAVPVESAVDKDKILAWWCPDCDTQLDAGFRASELSPDSTWPPVKKPGPLPAPGSGWTWRWWCTCGRNGTGWSATEPAAKAAVDRGTAAHNRAGHRWQTEWRAQ